MDGEARQATTHRVAKIWTRLSHLACRQCPGAGTDHILFLHLPISEPVDWLHLLALVNNATRNIGGVPVFLSEKKTFPIEVLLFPWK